MNFKAIKKLGKKNLLLLGGGLFLLIALPFLVKVAKEQQELRRGAVVDETGSGQVAVDFKVYDSDETQVTALEIGQSYIFRVGLYSVSGTVLKLIRVAGTQIGFDPDVISVNSVNCNPLFTGAVQAGASGNRISLSCYKTFAPFALPPLDQPPAFTLGEIGFTVESNLPAGTTSTFFDLAGANIPDGASSEALDLADEMARLDLSIASDDSPTCDPSGVWQDVGCGLGGCDDCQMQQLQESLWSHSGQYCDHETRCVDDNSCCGGPTNTPTPTDTPEPCPRGNLGNLDCSADGVIDQTDMGILVNFSNGCMSRTIANCTHPDLGAGANPDITGDGIVNESDLSRLLNHWGR